MFHKHMSSSIDINMIKFIMSPELSQVISISHTWAATFHSAFSSVISWRTNMNKAQYVLHKLEWNSVWTDIESTKYNV